MTIKLPPCYHTCHTSALNKISSRLPEAREFTSSFDTSSSVVDNARQAYTQRWYGNVSEQKAKDLTRHFTKRYILSPEHFKQLQSYIRHTSAQDFPWINHFHMLLADPYYRWATADFMPERYHMGLLEIPRSRFDQELKKQLPDTVGPGSLARYGQNLLTAIRDNGLLEGRNKKTIISPALSARTMAYMLYTLSELGVGTNEFDSSPLFLSLMKPRDLLIPLFHEGEHLGYWDFTGDSEKIRLNLNQPTLGHWLKRDLRKVE